MPFLSSDLTTIVAGIVTAVASGMFAWLASRRKASVDVALSLTSDLDSLTRRLEDENAALRNEIEQLRQEVADLVARLEAVDRPGGQWLADTTGRPAA